MQSVCRNCSATGEKKFELVFLVMDPGYAPQNRALIESNAQLLQIPVHIFETQIFDAVFEVQKNPCYLCARMRRGYLYEEAKRLGCNKIALGHHFDDVIETILMGMLYGAQMQSMPPKLWSTNHRGMQLIRPLYYVHEEDIIRISIRPRDWNFCAVPASLRKTARSTRRIPNVCRSSG